MSQDSITGQPEAPRAVQGEHAASRRRLAAVFAVTSLGAFMSSLDLSIVNVAFPALARSFPHDSRAALAWVITAYAIVFGALMVSGGRTADRLGRRHTFFTGIAVFCAGSAVCAAAPALAVLVTGRTAQAIGAALLVPSSLGLLQQEYPSGLRSLAVSLWSGVGGLAVATGPSLGAALIQAAGWRSAFYVNLPVGLIAWDAGAGFCPGGHGPNPPRQAPTTLACS
jgi:MFS family permease